MMKPYQKWIMIAMGVALCGMLYINACTDWSINAPTEISEQVGPNQ